MTSDVPSYQQLPAGDAAGVFGKDDVLGSLNRLTKERVRAAAALVVTGDRFSLNAPLDWPDPPLYDRTPVRHTVYRTRLGNRDDYLDGFFPQASSQWDAFPHLEDQELGFYNRQSVDDLGINTWARVGIVGRGVLLDVASFLEDLGQALHWRTRTEIGVDLLREVISHQQLEQAPGDILLLRTGWTAGYHQAGAQERSDVASDQTSPGLEASPAMLEFLWDWGVSAIASDNISVEVLPPSGDFILHPHLLNRLGIPIGELWWLDELAVHCRANKRWEFMVTSSPLNLPGGMGSPCNAIAIM